MPKVVVVSVSKSQKTISQQFAPLNLTERERCAWHAALAVNVALLNRDCCFILVQFAIIAQSAANDMAYMFSLREGELLRNRGDSKTARRTIICQQSMNFNCSCAGQGIRAKFLWAIPKGQVRDGGALFQTPYRQDDVCGMCKHRWCPLPRFPCKPPTTTNPALLVHRRQVLLLRTRVQERLLLWTLMLSRIHRRRSMGWMPSHQQLQHRPLRWPIPFCSKMMCTIVRLSHSGPGGSSSCETLRLTYLMRLGQTKIYLSRWTR